MGFVLYKNTLPFVAGMENGIRHLAAGVGWNIVTTLKK